MTIMCKECKDTKTLVCNPGKGGALIPRACSNQAAIQTGGDPCGLDPFVILPAKSKYVDQQELKLQVGRPSRLRANHTVTAMLSRISPCLASLTRHLHCHPTNPPHSQICSCMNMLMWGPCLSSMPGWPGVHEWQQGTCPAHSRVWSTIIITLTCTTEQLQGLGIPLASMQGRGMRSLGLTLS